MRLLLITTTLLAAFALTVTASKPLEPQVYATAMHDIVLFAMTTKTATAPLPKDAHGFHCETAESYDPKRLSCYAQGTPTLDQIKEGVAYLASHGVPVDHARYTGQGQWHEYKNNDWEQVDLKSKGLTPDHFRSTLVKIWCDVTGTTVYTAVSFHIGS